MTVPHSIVMWRDWITAPRYLAVSSQPPSKHSPANE